jgi:hypothetical protein
MKRDLFANVSLERKRGSPTRDSATGAVYPSRNKTYQALAPGLGLDPSDQYGWYTLCRMFPGRFVDVKTGRYIDARGSLS